MTKLPFPAITVTTVHFSHFPTSPCDELTHSFLLGNCRPLGNSPQPLLSVTSPHFLLISSSILNFLHLSLSTFPPFLSLLLNFSSFACTQLPVLPDNITTTTTTSSDRLFLYNVTFRVLHNLGLFLYNVRV